MIPTTLRARRILPGLVAALVLLALPAFAEPTMGWSELYDGGADLNDGGHDVVFTPDGHVVTASVQDTGSGYTDILLRKHDRETGEPLWTYTYADPIGNDMAISEILVDHRGDVLIAGYLSACDS
ncbi:hypothetical protein GF314_00375 [bacterium]|nr:hypothetical protein [bacterium]